MANSLLCHHISRTCDWLLQYQQQDWGWFSDDLSRRQNKTWLCDHLFYRQNKTDFVIICSRNRTKAYFMIIFLIQTEQKLTLWSFVLQTEQKLTDLETKVKTREEEHKSQLKKLEDSLKEVQNELISAKQVPCHLYCWSSGRLRLSYMLFV